MNQNWLSWFERQLEIAREKDLNRSIEISPAHRLSRLNKEREIDLSTNDYLGLSSNSAISSLIAASVTHGNGTTAARLAGGTSKLHMDLEAELAKFHGKQACLTFSSGYLANLGVISALIGKDDAIVSDKLNHASIIDAALLSRAKHYRYRHLDMEDLESKLDAATRRHKKVLLVSEAIFSMNGDLAPLREMINLKNKYGALFYLDEAHSVGVRGLHGEGLAAEMGVAKDIDIILATFGKAYAIAGSYIVSDEITVSHLVNTCRTFIFSTSMPIYNIAGCMASLEIIKESSQLRANLNETSKYMRQNLISRGFDIMNSDSHIIPILIGDNSQSLAVKKSLGENGVFVNAIRPPTVPTGSARLRLSLSAQYDNDDMETVLQHIDNLLKPPTTSRNA